jgi:hypothetical protein
VLVHAASLPNEPAGKHRLMTEPTETHPREDNRNEEIDESPVPDPLDKDPSSEDDPEAD